MIEDVWVIMPTRAEHDLWGQAAASATEVVGEERVLMMWDRDVLNLHEMWNAGTNAADTESSDLDEAYYLYLNDDVLLGTDTVRRMRSELVTDNRTGLVSVSREGGRGGVRRVIERDDGAFAGWCFMVRRSRHYRFPSWLCWWFGDDHIQIDTKVRRERIVSIPARKLQHHTSSSINPAIESDRAFAETIENDRIAFSHWFRTAKHPAPRPGRYGIGRGVVPAA